MGGLKGVSLLPQAHSSFPSLQVALLHEALAASGAALRKSQVQLRSLAQYTHELERAVEAECQAVEARVRKAEVDYEQKAQALKVRLLAVHARLHVPGDDGTVRDPIGIVMPQTFAPVHAQMTA